MWQRIYHIIFGYEFDFYSDYSLDECESALLANSEREYFRDNIGEIIKQQKNNAQLIIIEQTNSHSYRFTIEKTVQPQHRIFAVRMVVSGRLRQENIGTWVMGRSKIAFWEWVKVMLGAFLWVCVYAVTDSQDTLQKLLVIGLVAIFLWGHATSNSLVELGEYPEKILGEVEKKKKHTD